MALTLNGTTGLSGIAGSAGTPALQGNNDANTGYFFAADTLGLSTAGTERLRITSTGVVAINDTTPETFIALQVKNHSASNACQVLFHGADMAQLILRDETGGTNTKCTTLRNDQGNLLIGTHNDAYGGFSSKLQIGSDGKIGINTTSPIGTLDVYDGTFILSKPNETGNERNWRFLNNNAAAGNLGLQVSTAAAGSTFSNVIELTKEGKVGIGTTSPDQILHVKTSVNNTAQIIIESTATDSYPYLKIKNDAKEYQLTCHGGLSDAFTIYDGTSGAHRFTISSSGNVGIGTTSPDNNLHIHAGSCGTIDSAASSALTLEKDNSVSLQFLTPNDSVAQIRFGDPQDTGIGWIQYAHGTNEMKFGAYGPEKLAIRSGGDVAIADGNLVVASGHGIDFSATGDPNNGASTSELLDYYEEGTWTPSFGGLDSVSYSTQFGKYTRIGRQVFCSAVIDATGIDESNTIDLNGLPYSSTDSNDNGQRSTWLVAYGGHCSGISDATARFRSAGSIWQGVKGTGSTSYLTGAQLSSGGSVNITGSFSFYVA